MQQDVFWAITTRTSPEVDIFVEQFPIDPKTDDRGIPPTPLKQPLKGLRHRTAINAAIDRKTVKRFKRSAVKNSPSLNLAKFLAEK